MGLFEDFDNPELDRDAQYDAHINYDVDSHHLEMKNNLKERIEAKVAERQKAVAVQHNLEEESVVVCDPDFENPNGMFFAWLIYEKKMTPAEAFQINHKNANNYEELANGFAEFVANNSMVVNEDKNELIDGNPTVFAKMFKAANDAMKTYKIPEFDPYDKVAGRRARYNVKGASELTSELHKQVYHIDSYPYKVKGKHDLLKSTFENKNDNGQELPLNVYCGEIIPLNDVDKKHAQIKNELEKQKNYAFDLDHIMNDINDSNYSYNAVKMLVMHEVVKEIMGKTLDEAKPSVEELELKIRSKADDLSNNTPMKNISAERMINRLLGGKDDEIDELVSGKGALRISSAKKYLKQDNQKIKKVNDEFIKTVNKYKENQRKASNHGFKLRTEVAGKTICSALGAAKNSVQNEELAGQLNEISTLIDNASKSLYALNQPTTYKIGYNGDIEVEGVKPTLNFVIIEDGRLKQDTDYFDQFIDKITQIQKLVDNIKNEYKDKTYKYEDLPKEVKDTIKAAENLVTYDQHFIEWAEEFPATSVGLDEVKKNYVQFHEHVKQDNKNLENEIERHGNDNPLTMDAYAQFIDANNSLATDNLNVNIHNVLQDDVNADGKYVNAKEYIETLQRGVDPAQKNMTFDDFAKILAIRTLADATRNSLFGRTLNKNIDREALNNLVTEFKNEPSIKTAFQYAKVNPKRWEQLNKAFCSGHGGGIEDYYKTTLKVANFEDIPQGDHFARFRPTVKEKIEYLQDLVKNGSERYTSATMDIIVCRNVACAERDNKGKLDVVIDDNFLKKAIEQEKILKENKAYNKMVRMIDREELKKLITHGHGGAMSERIRIESEKVLKGQNKEISDVLWKNTPMGKADEINEELSNIKKDVGFIAENVKNLPDDDIKNTEYYKELDGLDPEEIHKMFKEAFGAKVNDFDEEFENIDPKNLVEEIKPDINTVMKREIAKAIVVKEMQEEGFKGSKSDYATDFSETEFVKRVDKLHKSADFGRVYTEMVKDTKFADNMNVENVNAKYHEVRQQFGLEKPAPSKGAEQKEPERQPQLKAPV